MNNAMKRICRASLLGMALCLISPGLAGAADMEGFGFHPYMGIGLGVYNLKYSQPAYSQRDNVFGGDLQLGADFNDYLGAELRIGTTAKGSNAYAGGTVDQSADYMFSYLLKLQYPTTPDLRLYGLIGGTTGKAKISPTPAGILSAGTKTATGLSYGLGLDYRLADQLRGGLEWVRYWDNIGINASGITSSKMTMDGYTATLKYLF